MSGDQFIDGEDELDPEVLDARANQELCDKNDEEHEEVEARRHLIGVYSRIFVEGKPLDGDVERLMLDLAHFCRGFETPYSPDERTHVLLAGRNEVFWRIMDHTRLDVDTLMKKYASAITR